MTMFATILPSLEKHSRKPKAGDDDDDAIAASVVIFGDDGAPEKMSRDEKCRSPIQGDPSARGKGYVDIKFKVPSQSWVTE